MKKYLLILALLACSASAASAEVLRQFSIETVWEKPRPGLNMDYDPIFKHPTREEYYQVRADNNTETAWLIEIDNNTGDSLRLIKTYTRNDWWPSYMYVTNDTNYWYGYGGVSIDRNVIFAKMDVETGEVQEVIEKKYRYPWISHYLKDEHCFVFRYTADKPMKEHGARKLYLDSLNEETFNGILSKNTGIDSTIAVILTNYVSPDRRYLIARAFTISWDNVYRYEARLILNASDFSIYSVLQEKTFLKDSLDYYKNKFYYDGYVFSDDGTKLAVNKNQGDIEIYDVSTMQIINTIEADVPNMDDYKYHDIQFDSTGNYLILNANITLVKNVYTGEIVYAGYKLPYLKRMPFSSYTRSTYGKYVFKLSTSLAVDEQPLISQITINSEGFTINAEENAQISKINIFDINGRTAYTNEKSNATPFSAQLSLSPGVYIAAILINGKSETYKVMVP